MPRHKGKKKKGRVIKPGFEDQLKEKFTNQINDKLKGLGLATLNLPTAAAADTRLDTDSALNASQFTYYTEADTQNEEPSQQANVVNIQADLEAAEEEEKKEPKHKKNLLSSRQIDNPNKIDLFKVDRKDSQDLTKSARLSTQPFTGRAEIKSTDQNSAKQAQVVVLDMDSSNLSNQQAEQQIEEPTPCLGPVEEEVEIVDTPFFDDFDAAFGSDNDVPELIIKKEIKHPEVLQETTETVVKQESVEPVLAAVAPIKEEEKVEGVFFDDFDAAFGSDNDVPLLIIKKEPKQLEAPKEVATPVMPEAPKEVVPPAKPVQIAAQQPSVEVKITPAPVEKQSVTVAAQPITAKVVESKPVTREPVTKPISPKAKPITMKVQGSQMLGPQGPQLDGLATLNATAAPKRQSQPSPVKETSIAAPPVKEKKSTTFTIEPIMTEKPEEKDTSPKVVTATKTPEETKNTTTKDIDDSFCTDSDEEDDTPSEGSGSKILMLGAMCAMAAGAFWYVKKNNIQVEEVVKETVKKIQDRIQEQFAKK